MSKKQKPVESHPDPADDDDVEILEVVGVDDDVPAPAHVVDEVDERADDIVLTLDADDGGAVADPVEAEPAAAPDEAPPPVDRSAAESELAARLRADYDNLRKRVAREREEFELQANSQLIESLLPVLDNFDRALSVEIRGDGGGAFRAGMVMIYNQLGEALKREGLCKIDSVGQSFDPKLHDAVATDGDSPEPPNTIVEELQRGYLFQERVLRPAMVKVSTTGDSSTGNTPDVEDR